MNLPDPLCHDCSGTGLRPVATVTQWKGQPFRGVELVQCECKDRPRVHLAPAFTPEDLAKISREFSAIAAEFERPVRK